MASTGQKNPHSQGTRCGSLPIVVREQSADALERHDAEVQPIEGPAGNVFSRPRVVLRLRAGSPRSLAGEAITLERRAPVGQLRAVDPSRRKSSPGWPRSVQASASAKMRAFSSGLKRRRCRRSFCWMGTISVSGLVFGFGTFGTPSALAVGTVNSRCRCLASYSHGGHAGLRQMSGVATRAWCSDYRWWQADSDVVRSARRNPETFLVL
jgi:hypothetical protein